MRSLHSKPDRRQLIFCSLDNLLFAGAMQFSESITPNVRWPTDAQSLTTSSPLQSLFCQSQHGIRSHTSMHGNGLKIWRATPRMQRRLTRLCSSRISNREPPHLQPAGILLLHSTAPLRQKPHLGWDQPLLCLLLSALRHNLWRRWERSMWRTRLKITRMHTHTTSSWHSNSALSTIRRSQMNMSRKPSSILAAATTKRLLRWPHGSTASADRRRR